jgi:hypothetical protein
MGRPRSWVRRGMALLVGVTVVGLTSPICAQPRDYGSMYEDRLLQQKEPDYRRVILGNLDNVFLPRMTPEERRRLQGVDVQFPLRGPQRGPFEYFAAAPRVVLPVMAIRFLGDLAVAYAWLDTNNYAMETVTDYISMLKYQDPSRFGGRYPDPRTALGIPANATDDPRVDLISGKILNESISFVLLHELGHILYQHPGYGPGVAREHARENEDQADRFALEVLRRVGQPVDGLLFFLLAMAHFVSHRADFGSDAQYQAHLRQDTHPLTSDRVHRLAQYLRTHAVDYGRLQNNPERAAQTIRWVADAIDREVVPVLADPDQQRLMAMKGQRVSVETLTPRRRGETMGRPVPPAPGPEAPARAFDGIFDGEMRDGTGTLPVRAILRRQGDRVSGVYSFGAGQGEISGFAEGDTLIFVWRAGGQSGRGRVRAIGDGGRFSGTWGRGESPAGGGTWNGARVTPPR